MLFEDGMAELEEIVEQLEKGSLSLEESFTAYEKAKKLANELDAILKEHEQRVRVLTENGSEEDTYIEVTEE